MPNNMISNLLQEKSPDLYSNYSTNCIVIKQMLEKYKKDLPNIADYTILHFMDIMEFLEIIIPKDLPERLSAEECYCILMAALCIHTGLGLDSKILSSYIREKGIADDISELTANDLRMKYCMVGSIYLFEKYSDFFEIPAKELKGNILYFMNCMSDNMCPWTEAPENIREELILAANALTVANSLAELQNRNTDLSYNEFDEYSSKEIRSFVERISVSSVYRENSNLVVNAKGSHAVLLLVQHKIDLMNEKISASGNSFDIKGIILRHSANKKDHIFLNESIEKSWTAKDHELFSKLSPTEQSFYLEYLSAEFAITKSLKDFVSKNNAQLYGIEFRVKSPKSIYEKLYTRNYPLEKLTDVIRYSIILEPATYVEDIRRLIDLLERAGWKTYSLQNYWNLKNVPYNAVNSNLINDSGICAELQYHTMDSFRIKMSDEDHELYKLRCTYAQGSREYNEILKKQFALYIGMEIPRNIESLKDIE